MLQNTPFHAYTHITQALLDKLVHITEEIHPALMMHPDTEHLL